MGRWLREFGAALVVALSGLVLDPTSALAVPQVFLAGDVPLAGNTSRPLQPLPVLFVHGHKPDTDTSTEPHYRVTWQTALGSLPSFAQALTHSQNAGLGIEAYYIHFTDHNRSIADDAREIGEAVELILQRHDPAYVPGDPQHPTNVQVVLIGYSKGAARALRGFAHRDQHLSGRGDMRCLEEDDGNPLWHGYCFYCSVEATRCFPPYRLADRGWPRDHKRPWDNWGCEP